MSTNLAFSTTYHPHTDGQTERVNMVLEDMLRMYMMQQQNKWEEYIPLVEFAYNNDYQDSLRMSPFEALYGWNCNTPISWSDPLNMVLIGMDMLVDMEQAMQVIKKNLKAYMTDRKVMWINTGCSRSFRLGSVCICAPSPRKSL